MLFFIFHILLKFVLSKELSEENEKTIMNIYYSKETGKYNPIVSPTIDEDAVAYAIYNKSYERIGWDFLSISSYTRKDNKYNDSIKAYAMGYLEGVLTKNRIYDFTYNLLFNQLKINSFPENLKEFYKENLEYMKETSTKNMNSDSYWEHVHYIYQQLVGMYEGYINSIDEEKKNFFNFDLYNFSIIGALGDFNELYIHFSEEKNTKTNFKNMTDEEIKSFIISNSHCSALIKLADDFSDIWFGHNTWITYLLMIRIYKEYRFISNKEKEKSKINSFSSYPGTLSSLDDYYYLDSNLLVMETTIIGYKDELYNLLTPKSLFTWVRAILANRLAGSGEEWTQIFKKENSGTYSNQFMILDLNRIDLNKKDLKDKALMIIEQMPNYTETFDATDHLLNNKYWPSYNVPFSPYIFEKTGFYEMIKEKPSMIDDIDYYNCSRAKIFKRDQGKIKTSEDFKKMMRYNDFENDNFSHKDPSLTIASRMDLGKNNNRCSGATDAKFISVKEILEGKNIVHIISGPTNEQQPTFSWKNTTCYLVKNISDFKIKGLNEDWNFPWFEYSTQLKNNDKEKENEKDNKDKKFILIIVIILVVFLILIVALIFFCKNKNRKGDVLLSDVKTISFKKEEDNNKYNEITEDN